MKSFRCTICGETILGSKAPHECPFCGVRERYVMELEKVHGGELFSVKDISSDSTKNLIQALSMETTSASFYKCASEKSESESMRALFKRLAKIEREHADIIRKYLELDPIDFIEEECSVEDEKNIEKAIISTKENIKFYRVASTESIEPKISNLFRALMEAEEGILKFLKTFGVRVGKNIDDTIPPVLYRTKSK